MKCLILLLGESFRSGLQNSRLRGSEKSYLEQIDVSTNHLNFIYFLEKSYNITVSLHITTYDTIYNDKLFDIYKKYLVSYSILTEPEGIGLHNLYYKSLCDIKNIKIYNFFFYFRIDIFLKPYFFDLFNPFWETIHFSFPMSIKENGHMLIDEPRVSDTMLFIPNKYFYYLDKVYLYHSCWFILINKTDLVYNNIDFIINTFHDSDSYKDNNPLYYIINRPREINIFSFGYIFNKNEFYDSVKHLVSENSEIQTIKDDLINNFDYSNNIYLNTEEFINFQNYIKIN